MNNTPVTISAHNCTLCAENRQCSKLHICDHTHAHTHTTHTHAQHTYTHTLSPLKFCTQCDHQPALESAQAAAAGSRGEGGSKRYGPSHAQRRKGAGGGGGICDKPSASVADFRIRDTVARDRQQRSPWSKQSLALRSRVGQNVWPGNHQIYGHVRCMFVVLANPIKQMQRGSWS